MCNHTLCEIFAHPLSGAGEHVFETEFLHNPKSTRLPNRRERSPLLIFVLIVFLSVVFTVSSSLKKSAKKDVMLSPSTQVTPDKTPL
jgi:hypothetical protein